MLKDRPARLGESVRRALEDSQRRAQNRRAETALRQSEDRFRDLDENSRDLLRMIGDMSMTERVLVGLDLREKN